MGSHGGDTRVIRHAYAESPEYVPLVLRADALWQELEAETGQQVLIRCGGLELAAPGYHHASLARASADEHGLPYEWLPAREAAARWPAFQIPDDWDALYSPGTGFLLTEPALRGMAALAKRHGATLLEHSPATNWGSDNGSVWVETPSGRYEADALIVTAGAWAGSLLAELGLPLHIRRKTLWWQDVDDPARYQPDRFPVFIADSAAGEIYGFPIYGTPALKIANHAGGEVVDVETVDRETRPGENRDCLELAAQHPPRRAAHGRQKRRLPLHHDARHRLHRRPRPAFIARRLRRRLLRARLQIRPGHRRAPGRNGCGTEGCANPPSQPVTIRPRHDSNALRAPTRLCALATPAPASRLPRCPATNPATTSPSPVAMGEGLG